MGCRSCQPGAFQSCFAASRRSSGPSESSTWPIRPGSLPRLPRASGSDEQHRCGSHPVGRRSLNCGRSSRYLDRRAGWRGDQQSRSEAALDADNPGRGMSRRLARVHPSIRGPVAGELPTHASTGGETAVGLGTVESSPSGAQSGCRSPHRGSCPPDRRRRLGVEPAHRTGRPEGSRLVPGPQPYGGRSTGLRQHRTPATSPSWSGASPPVRPTGPLGPRLARVNSRSTY
jgi:hypothetical protein